MSGVGWTGPNVMADPDLQIRRWGGGAQKKSFFAALWASVWSKNKGGGEWATRAPPLDPPLKCSYMEHCFYV